MTEYEEHDTSWDDPESDPLEDIKEFLQREYERGQGDFYYNGTEDDWN